MRTRHLVDTALFDIAFSDEETAFQAQTELETLIKRQLLQVVDEVFDQRSRSGFVLRIPILATLPMTSIRKNFPDVCVND